MNFVVISFLKLAFFAKLFVVDCHDDVCESEKSESKQRESNIYSRQRRKEQEEMLNNFESKNWKRENCDGESLLNGREGIGRNICIEDLRKNQKKWEQWRKCVRCVE